MVQSQALSEQWAFTEEMNGHPATSQGHDKDAGRSWTHPGGVPMRCPMTVEG